MGVTTIMLIRALLLFTLILQAAKAGIFRSLLTTKTKDLSAPEPTSEESLEGPGLPNNEFLVVRIPWQKLLFGLQDGLPRSKDDENSDGVDYWFDFRQHQSKHRPLNGNGWWKGRNPRHPAVIHCTNGQWGCG